MSDCSQLPTCEHDIAAVTDLAAIQNLVDVAVIKAKTGRLCSNIEAVPCDEGSFVHET